MQSEAVRSLSISVVMPTHERRRQLPVVLDPLLGDRGVDEIVVVVDGSQDGSIEWLRSTAAVEPRLQPVLRTEAGGAQCARADGLLHARGDVVLFLDDDVRAEPGLTQGHLAHHIAHHGLVVVGYMPVSRPATRRPGEFTSILYAEEYDAQCRSFEDDPGRILRHLWWGNVSMRRTDAASVGMVSRGLEAVYHEDQDFGLRCLEMGLSGEFDRELRATHLHQRNVDGFVRDAKSQGSGRALVHQRHADVLGTLSPTEFETGLRAPLRWIVHGAKFRAFGRMTCAVLRSTVRVAGSLHLFAIETAAARLLRRVAQRMGAESAWNGRVVAARTDSSR